MLFQLRQLVKPYERAMTSWASASVKLATVAVRARVELLHQRQRVGVAGAHRLAQTLGLFPEMLEGRIVPEADVLA